MNDHGVQLKRDSVKAGYCGSSNDGNPCVLERSDCQEVESWRSSREMMGAPYMAHGGKCAWSSTVKDIVKSMQFGACIESSTADRRCSWSERECIEGEEWYFPDVICSCDQVRVGGCEKDGQAFCAVSEDACDEYAIWLDSLNITKATDTECYMCIAKSSPLSNPPSAPPTTAPFTSLRSPSNTTVITIGVTLVGVLFLMFLAAILIHCRHGSGISGSTSKSVANTDPPADSIDISSQRQDCENDDCISNLDDEEFEKKFDSQLS